MSYKSIEPSLRSIKSSLRSIESSLRSIKLDKNQKLIIALGISTTAIILSGIYIFGKSNKSIPDKKANENKIKQLDLGSSIKESSQDKKTNDNLIKQLDIDSSPDKKTNENLIKQLDLDSPTKVGENAPNVKSDTLTKNETKRDSESTKESTSNNTEDISLSSQDGIILLL